LLLRLDQGRWLMPRRFAHATAITVPMADQFQWRLSLMNNIRLWNTIPIPGALGLIADPCA
jgi:hypothetical protein